MIPPAVRIQRTSRSPAPAITRAERLRAREALHRVRQVRVRLGRRRAARAAARRDRTTARRTSTSGGLVGVVISSTTTRPPGPHDPRHLAQARARGRRSCARRSRRSRRRTRRRRRAARARWPTPSAGRGAFCAARARACPRRSPSRPPRRRADAARQLDRQVAGAGRDVERPRSPGPTPREVGRALAPAMVQPGRHDRVHQVVDARDAIEHRADLPLLEGAAAGRRGAHGYSPARRSALELARGSRPARSSSPRAGPRTTASARSGSRACAGSPPCGSLSPMSVRCGPGPSLPFSPILWHARQPDWAATSLPASYCLAGPSCRSRSASRRWRRGRSGRPSRRSRRCRTSVAIGRRSGRRSGPRSMNGSRNSRIMQIVGMPIVASGVEHGRLDHAQQLEEEEEVPLRPRHVGRRRRVRLRPELGAEDRATSG